METVFARLAPLEARLAEIDPTAALDRFAARLEAVQKRVETIEAAENPFAEISEQLTRLYAQKDATVETVFARLAPLEARLAELDPRAPLDRFAERLEAVQGRVASLETAENPFAEISEQLTRLYAQKDATVETVFARLAPLEARLDALGQGLDRLAPLAEDDLRAGLDGLKVRIEALHWAQGETAAGLAALRAAAEAARRRGRRARRDRRPADPALRPEGRGPCCDPRPARAARGAARGARGRPARGGRRPRRGPGGGGDDRGRGRRRRDRALRRPDRRARGAAAAGPAAARPSSRRRDELEAILALPGLVSLHRQGAGGAAPGNRRLTCSSDVKSAIAASPRERSCPVDTLLPRVRSRPSPPSRAPIPARRCSPT